MPSDRFRDTTGEGDSQPADHVDDLPPPADDIGAAFVQYTALPKNRSFPLPKPQLLSSVEKIEELREASQRSP